jgi:tetratricopeptide (TPR) repeat protein
MQNKHEKAKDILEMAYSIDPNNININSYLAGLYMHLNLYEKAIPHLRKINDKEKNQNIQKLLILSLEEISNRKIEEEDYKQAKEYAEELINLNDEYHGGYKLLGIINHKMGNPKNASEFYIKAFQRLSDDINIANLLTHSLIEINDYENAKFTNNKALQIDPNNRLANDLKKEIDKKIDNIN